VGNKFLFLFFIRTHQKLKKAEKAEKAQQEKYQ